MSDSKRKSRPSSLKKSQEVKDNQAVNMDVFTDPDKQVKETDSNTSVGLGIESFLSSLPGGDGYGNYAGTDRITRYENGTLSYRGWNITSTGLVPPDNVTEDDYSEIGRLLLQLEGSLQWLLGDWLKEGENRQWGKTYEQVADEFGYKVKTLQDYASICRHVETSIRIEVLSFGHHQLVAKYSKNPLVQQFLLQSAASKRWSIKQFRDMLKAYASVIEQAVNQGWNIDQFEAALTDFDPDANLPALPSEPPNQWVGAKRSWHTVHKVSERLQRGKLPSPQQQAEVKDEIAVLRKYLDVLESQIDELSQ